jgi:heme exporter protein D
MPLPVAIGSRHTVPLRALRSNDDMDLGPHAAFIWISYTVVALTVVALIFWLIIDGWKQTADLEALERQGVKRRSSTAGER